MYLIYEQVLVTSWIEGEKLSKLKKDDSGRLMPVALNCYLSQLLESGYVHVDPHPGNLMQTVDGRLGVLDFGLMIQVEILISKIYFLQSLDCNACRSRNQSVNFIVP